MKKIIVCAVLALATVGLFAQEAGKIRGSLNAGAAIPAGGGFGVAFDLNLGYNIWDNLNVGARFGGAAMVSVNEDAGSVGAATNTHILATGTYFFNPGNSGFAIFGGVGLGAYIMQDGDPIVIIASPIPVSAQAEGGTVFGCMLTAGFEFGRFRVAAEYHLVGNSPVSATVAGIGTPSFDSRNNNYFAITIGFTIGGGRWGR
ncbi:MAG: hypothetical protein FWC94_06515 [Bacteroidales bacterium]|nr:hypothetical protein [Bacteroidales bacterium]